jgi:hypothetical protein
MHTYWFNNNKRLLVLVGESKEWGGTVWVL